MSKLLKIFGLLSIILSCQSTDTKERFAKHIFIYHSTDAEKVSVAGSFNNWSADANPMIYNENGKWQL